MAGEKNEQSWIEKLQYKYRLMVMNDDTFEEVGIYNISRLSILLLALGISFLIALITSALIAFTPLRTFIPGYGDKYAEIFKLRDQLNEMEEELVAQRQYSDSFRRILVGDVQTEEEVKEEASEEIPDSLLNISKIKEDSLLRKEIELSQQRTRKGANGSNGNSVSLPLEQMFFTPPINGTISEGYMPEKRHYGVDVMAPKNTPIKTIMDGYVISSDWTLETGNTIGVQHANNVISFYKHNSALLKKVGDYVKAGEAIAIIGNTGTLSSGPHLHFELWHNGQTVNPVTYVQF